MIGLVLNPIADGYSAELDLADGVNFIVLDPLNLEPPAVKPAYASSYDTEGSIATAASHYENREITVRLRVYGTSVSGIESCVNALERMIGQINQEGGTLGYTSPNGTVCYFDLLPEAQAVIPLDGAYMNRFRADVGLRLVARPFWRGTEVDQGTVSETVLPVLTYVVAGVGGDVPALGRLVVTDTEAGGRDRWTVLVGGQSRYHDSAATAKLFYQAEDLTPTGTSTKVAGATGASGAGSNVIRNTDLTTTYQAILKSEIDATNAALTHRGTFRVWARLYRPTGNTGAVSVRLEWAEGDYLRTTLNDPVAYAADDREGVFTWANLGIVSIDPASTRWEFRLLAASTVPGDEADVDCFVLFPTEVTYTELSGRLRFQNPSSFSARDEFNQTPGNLTGLTAPIGGVWAGAGDASVDWTVSGQRARRVVSAADLDADLNTGRYAVSGVSAFAAQAVQGDLSRDAAASGDVRWGLLARYTDTANWLLGHVEIDDTSSDNAFLCVSKRVSGTVARLGTVLLYEDATVVGSTFMGGDNDSHRYRMRLQADAAGRWAIWWGLATSPKLTLMLMGVDTALATGGTLASGKPGFYVAKTSGATQEFYIDNWFAFPPVPDAAVFATRSLELRHDRATRLDATGAFSSKISVPDGRYLKIPPAGPEGRSTRLVAMGLGNDPYTMGDSGIFDTSAQLYVTARGLVVPEA